jgi:C4-dicarboxylate-specific signal transduction histidine kinase
MNKSKLKKPFKLFKKHFEHFEDNMQNKELQKAYNELKESYVSLQNYKDLLEIRVEDEIKKQQINEKILARQARLAAMGEMMDAVAHQWSQPLSIIDMRINLMTEDFKNGLVDKKYIKETVKSVNKQKEHLLLTLKKFRYFFNPIDKNENFDVDIMVKDTLVLLKDEILKNKIAISYEPKGKNIIYGSSNEIKHVLINLLNNSKDSFNSKNIENRLIKISIKDKPMYLSLTVEDNAGGIDENIIKKIFKPYVSTKKSNEGSGIGLYMSSLIMQKYNGKIRAKNVENGAKFLLKFYKEL